MTKKILIAMCTFIVLIFLCLITTSFASQEEDVVNFYKSVFNERNACSNFDQYDAFNRKYTTKEVTTYEFS